MRSNVESPSARRRPGPAVRLAPVALAALVVACVPEAVVDVVTRVFPAGGIERTVTIEGRTGEGELPSGRDWLREQLDVGLARPEAWSSRDVSTGVVEATAYFRNAADIPPTLMHHLDGGRTAVDRGSVRVDVDDLVVLRRWRYVETWGDPFGPGDAAEAVDRLLEVIGRVLRDELRWDLGGDVDLSGVDGLLAGPVRLALLETIQVERRFAATPDDHARARALTVVLERAGVDSVASVGDEVGFWDANAGAIRDALARDIARAIATPERPVDVDELGFVRAGDDLPGWFETAVGRTFGSTEELEEEITPLLAALQGGYGGAVRTRFRFRSRVELPGRLVRTNGTPDGDATVWVFRGESLLQADRVLRAESIELDGERLRALGALREFTVPDLLAIEDLLAEGDTGRGLRDVLRAAVDAGSLAALRDPEALPDRIVDPARRLADLLEGTGPGADR